jgi:hypothetical protein
MATTSDTPKPPETQKPSGRKVLRGPVLHNGEVFAEGCTMPFPDAEIQPLIDSGIVE